LTPQRRRAARVRIIVPRVVFVILALALAGGFALNAEPAQARTGSCLIPGAAFTCYVWTGKVTYIGDGDTIYVDVDGDGTRKSQHIRLTGFNAAEQTVYSGTASRRRGDCHAVEATNRLEQVIKRSRGRVRIAALDASSKSGSRPRRAVAVRLNGRWRDVGRILLSEGHAVWLPAHREWAWNAEYSRVAEFAASQLRGMWSPTYCGLGPSDTSPLRVLVNADADFDDHDFLNGEWVRIRNLDPVNQVSLGGWWMRDSSLRRYTFPSWAALPPGQSLTVYVGEGTDTGTEFFWNQRSPVFENPGRGDRGLGDGAYLVDPHGDIRSWMTYPCRRNCTDPYQGALDVSAKPRGREYVTVTNVAAFAVDLDGYRLQSPPFSYAFRGDAVLNPGETMKIEVTGDPAADTRLEKHWGETGAILNNGGDKIRLTNFRYVVLDCFTYGTGTC
jgi:endonuclease YncB( thermonuclease family)